MSGPARCLLLGGAGFMGLNLAQALAGSSKVRIFDRPASILRLQQDGYEGFEWVEGDFSNAKDVHDAVQGCDAVFHLVSTTLPKSSNDNPAYDVESNVISTIHMLESARKCNVKMVLFSSSGGTVYGIPQDVPIKESHPTEPTCSYGIAKLAIEKYLRLYRDLYGLDYRILRIANPYGEHQRTTASQGAVAVFLSRALRGEPIEVWGDGSVVRDFLYVGDVCAAFLKAMRYRGDFRIFNIGAGSGHSINRLLDEIEAVAGRPIVRRHLAQRSFDVPVNVLDITRAREELGYEPTMALRDGLSRTVEWLRTAGMQH